MTVFSGTLEQVDDYFKKEWEDFKRKYLGLEINAPKGANRLTLKAHRGRIKIIAFISDDYSDAHLDRSVVCIPVKGKPEAMIFHYSWILAEIRRNENGKENG